MLQVDHTSDTLTEDYWRDTRKVELPVETAPVVQEGRVARFFHSLAASIALQKRASVDPHRQQTIMYPIDILAQNYPHLYLRVMCG